MTTQEILDIFDKQDEQVDAIYITPPEVHCDSDADSGEEDGGGLIDNLNGRQKSNSIMKIRVIQIQHKNLPKDLKVKSHLFRTNGIQLTNFGQPLFKRSMKLHNLLRVYQEKHLFKSLTIFMMKLIDLIVSESIKYSAQNNVQFSVTASEIKVVLGILLLFQFDVCTGVVMQIIVT